MKWLKSGYQVRIVSEPLLTNEVLMERNDVTALTQ
jgi:hypothetical protein